MELDVEVIPLERDYTGSLLMVLLYRLGLAETIIDSTVLMRNGAVFVNGNPVKDLNFRLRREKTTIVVGLRGVELIP